MSDINNEGAANEPACIKDDIDKITIEDKFIELSDIIDNYDGKHYGSYIWNKEKKKWVRKKFG